MKKKKKNVKELEPNEKKINEKKMLELYVSKDKEKRFKFYLVQHFCNQLTEKMEC